MSGHSKWHNIQKTKGAQDAKRAASFTKIAKEMIVAVKEGGGSADPAYNSRLATVITKAKAANMPNDNIKRVLEKAGSAGSGDNYESITYEGYGPGGVAVIVETMTDNRNRTAGSVRHHFDKYGGNLGANGCVSWSFDKKGVLVIDNEDGDYEEDQVMMDAMDCGADDFEADDDVFTVYTTPDDFNAVADALAGKADVVAADGFVGNVLLKNTEGVIAMIFGLIKGGLMDSTKGKLAALLAKDTFRGIKRSFDSTEIGGAPLLGVEGAVIKARAIFCAIRQARSMVDGGVVDVIRDEVAKLSVGEEQA